ncbi:MULTISPECIES: response regulator transcription factor [Prosthecochloris]|uniref:Response regulator transcription factor n=1 Tax=Prosthecochloris vibrioformis TaxID=1098 RepID=A0A5C4S3G0_PROVB|nr:MULTISPECIES: response regulator transcription factor [Prosthecochloris]ANT65583.1 Mycobacterial persistence regulator A [Prosthecochloris sp. CIB 2401]TNJ38036.1 response regulator transcription factor [Prosthecochloris vibrioformis]
MEHTDLVHESSSLAEQVRSKNSIIIVEDDRDFRESIVETLSLHGYDVTGAESALDFYRKIAEKSFQLVILDLGLPDQKGVVLAEYIRVNTAMRIIILTAQGALESRISAYKAGADTYLLKPVDTSELIASIESNMGRICDQQVPDSPGSLSVGQQVLPVRRWKLLRSQSVLVSPNGYSVKLSSREYDVLELLASVTDQVVSRSYLIEALGYEDTRMGSRSLDVLIHRMRQKASAIKERLPIKTVHGQGYSISGTLLLS